MKVAKYCWKIKYRALLWVGHWAKVGRSIYCIKNFTWKWTTGNVTLKYMLEVYILRGSAVNGTVSGLCPVAIVNKR